MFSTDAKQPSQTEPLAAGIAPSLASAVLLWTACVLPASPARGDDVVLDWNATMTDVLRDNTSLQNPGMASRTMAMMNLAIYDAFAMTSPGGTMFYNYGQGRQSPGINASTDAAAAQAAYTVLSSIYGDQSSTLDAALAASLGDIADGQHKSDGVALGTSIGQSIIANRQNDGYDTSVQYLPTNAPGHWQPDPLNPGQEAWGPAWGDVLPFAIESGTQFMPPPMPELTSQKYTDAFNEVKEKGVATGSTRLPDETEAGIFWAYDRVGMGTPMRLYNDAMRNVAEQEGNSPEQNAELFAKASVAVADAGITAWNSKFAYDFWRPVTGIREADTDGNDDTIAIPDWTPLGAPGGDDNDFTPPFPTYLSGHATFGGALFEMLKQFYGRDDIAFSLDSEELADAGYSDITREFSSFSEAMAENGRSRVYLGIHWNFDDTVAQVTGAQVAQYLATSPFIASVPEPSSAACLAIAAALTAPRRRRRRAA
ncbi:MAG: vanadium-dependent haloperoxidase [Planctomycetota bacterium]